MVTSSKLPALDTSFERWSHDAGFADRWPVEQIDAIHRAFDEAAQLIPASRNGLQAADLLCGLGLDPESAIAGLLHEAYARQLVSFEVARVRYSDRVAELLRSATYLHRIGNLADRQRTPEQLESLRKMLLAMAQDIRVVLVMLAIRLCLMRSAPGTPQERQRIAQETLNIFAPLANRLGIGQIKWELEDLALRDLKPDVYKAIAQALHERRADREIYIQDVAIELRGKLADAGLQADVSGRAKHIFSIWSKMQRKRLLFDQLFDVRALRILVDDVGQCYTALGVIHGQWKNIQQEFDDYIANPKGNGYQSLHTAVVGPQGKTVEVQIRTRTMHRHAEFGVAAHWRYKEGGDEQDQVLEKQIQWFRQMLEFGTDEGPEMLDQMGTVTPAERVYVQTPNADIIDLAFGSTPLDFAYSIHTEVGHRCRGARINGRIAPLSYQLQNGDQVEIITVKEGAPSRDWLSQHLGYLRTTRARSKVRHWFRQLDRDKNILAGRRALEQEFRRLAIAFKRIDLEQLAHRFEFEKEEELLAAIGSGDLTTTSVSAAIQHEILPVTEITDEQFIGRSKAKNSSGDIVVRGVGNLMTQIARCCHPIPFESIVGYITQGRGVSIHRADCTNMLHLRSRYPQRMLEVEWGQETDNRYAVDVELDAYDRPGLLRDVTTILANDSVNVVGVNTRSDPRSNTARMALHLEIESLQQLSRVLEKIGRLSSVIHAFRKE